MFTWLNRNSRKKGDRKLGDRVETGTKLKKLHVKNVQSIKDLVVTFDENGVFQFKGANNVGKSALLKALTVVMRNVSNNQYKDFLRDEEKTFEVTFEDFSGNKVHLSRGAVDFYEWEINGKKGRMDKTQGKVPLEVRDFFNLYEENEKTKTCLNIRLPRETLLFVDTTPGDNAMMFQKALGTEEYMLAIKQVDSRAREINKEVKLVEGYLEQEQETLDETNKKLATEEQSVKNMERYEEKLRQEYEEFKQVEHMLQLTGEYASKKKEVKEKKEIIQQLDVKPIKDGIDKLSALIAVEDAILEKEKLEKSIKQKNNKLDQFNLDNFDKEFQQIEKIEEFISLFQAYKLMVTDLKEKKEQGEQAKAELDAFKEEVDVCPFCGSELSESHTH